MESKNPPYPTPALTLELKREVTEMQCPNLSSRSKCCPLSLDNQPFFHLLLGETELALTKSCCIFTYGRLITFEVASLNTR